MEQKPITAIIVGAGHRAFVYSKLAKTNPEMLKIVGVADPNPIRRKKAMEEFGFSEDMCFENAEELAKHGKLADTVINGTMDEQHLETAVPLLNAGYDMLLEKPFAPNEDEMRQIVDCAKKNNSKVMICHVLRYTPFYYGIKERIVNGEIGDIINIQTTEHVSYHHLSTSYVRGKWAFYVWDALENIENPTIEDKIALMKSDNPYARCIYKCDNNVVDHQSVLVNFASGATGTHNMVGGSAEPRRDIHIIGTKGEIFGNFEESKFTVLKINPSPDAHNEECDVEEVDLKVTGDMVGAYGGHGGGDERLAADFVKFIRGEKPSLACTSIFDSVAGHLSVYLADESRENGGMPQEVKL